MIEPTSPLFDGITARQVDTARISARVLLRDGDRSDTPAERTVVLLHGLLSSSLIWQEFMEELPSDLRVVAIDLRGFGGTESLPVDATRGLGDFADDLRAVLDALEIRAAHLVGTDLGASIAAQYALDGHGVLSLTLQAPFSPYGLGGTRLDGTRLTDDGAGTGAATANAEFVRRLTARDKSDESPASPRSVFRAEFVSEAYRSAREDVWVDAMLSTSTAGGNYPGDTVTSPNWPGAAPGDLGVLNALAPTHFDQSALAHLGARTPVLWIHGELDAIVSDASFLDPAHLGSLGILPDWPGADEAPSQPMVSQTRAVLDADAATGADVRELIVEGAGHLVHLERPAAVRQALLEVIGYIGHAPNPAPPTETIVLKSSD
ncbi:alpha/beta hydrolase [Microbacterium sp. CIAB417]|uniref:alpha/beta hydrolase n=1 Tax=Microbacterium sp. CIAB417 TaxID=2860287 RepID=UPI001FABA88D|nr:alpha/beta fold hydrolase [Microbacterium sp. CIAB417]